MIDGYSPDPSLTQALFEQFKQLIAEGDFFDDTLIKTIVDALGERSTLETRKLMLKFERANFNILTKIFEDIVEFHLSLRNKLPMTSFPIEGNVPRKNEASRVQAAKGNLARLYEALPEELTIYAAAEHVPKIVKNMTELYWYPKIPEEKLIDISSPRAKITWQETIDRKGYTSGTVPRDNSEENLVTTLSTHIVAIFHCFPLFFSKELQESVISAFVKHVLSNEEYGWQCEESYIENELLPKIMSKLPVYILDEIHSAHETSDTSRFDSSSQDDGSTNDSDEMQRVRSPSSDSTDKPSPKKKQKRPEDDDGFTGGLRFDRW